jgi:pimeloyl-ACP methyl ester carboxylesterase
MRETPMWAGMEAVAHTLAYDGRIVDGFTLRADELSRMSAPALVMAGGQTPWMSSGAQALAQALRHGEYRSLKGQGHDVGPEVIAPVLVEFFSSND